MSAELSSPICEPRRRCAGPGWPGVLCGLGLMAAVLLGLAPRSAVAQQGDATAWWARVNAVDDATRCGAGAAWAHAMQVETQAEFDGSTDALGSVLIGPELTREQRVVAALQEHAQQVARTGWLDGRIIGGAPDEVVVYASTTRRVALLDPATSEAGQQQSVEESQAAYRLVNQNGTWLIADQHVFEQTRHDVDAAELRDVATIYARLWSKLGDAYASRDLAGLEEVLGGQALEDYRQRVQSLLNEGAVDQLPNQGTVTLLDLQAGVAVGSLQATLVPVDADQTTEQQPQAQASSPVQLEHRLQLADGQWKIVDEVQATTRTNPDGSVQVDGC